MWADRFLDGTATGYGEWEAATNGTQDAISKVPKDIVMCDWHYEKRTDYPSLSILTDHGFRVWPAGWKDVDAVTAFATQAKAMNSRKILGYLCTTWGAQGENGAAGWPPLLAGFAVWK